MDWGEMNARARGLAGHLLDRPALAALARQEDSGVVSARVERSGLLPDGWAAAHPSDLDAGVRRRAGRLLAPLWRRAGDAEPLRVLFELEEVRSLRLLIRGAAGGTPASGRLEGLVPTPRMPEELLEAAARASDPADTLRLLAGARVPLVAELVEAAGARSTDLFRLERELAVVAARRWSRGARGAHPHLRAHVAEEIDLLNAWSVLAAEAWRDEIPPEPLFADGGVGIGREDFVALCRAEREARRSGLAAAFAGGRLAPVFADPSRPPSGLEGDVITARIRAERRAGLADPLSPAPVLWFVARLRAQVVDLARILWGAALGVPSGAVSERLVSPPRAA